MYIKTVIRFLEYSYAVLCISHLMKKKCRTFYRTAATGMLQQLDLEVIAITA